MKIIIEPTTDQSERPSEAKSLRVTVEHPCDDLDIYEIVELIQNALMAYGFHPNNIKDIFNPEGDDG